MRSIYWQLVLPPNEHVVVSPESFTGEYRWGWHGYFWGRRPLLDQTQLESWAGATSQAPLPENSSIYLYSTFGNVDRLKLYTAGRAWIVLLASGVALMAGLLLIYMPLSRHPATLLVFALTMLSAGAIFPETTLLLAQAASLGLVLTLLAGLLNRGVARRRIARVSEISNSRVELGSTRAPYRPTVVGNSSSLQKLPVSLPPGTRDVEA